jgi:toxin ParE1/3/4
VGTRRPLKIIWSAASVRHLQETFDFLEGESAGMAIATRRRILDTAKRLGQMPYSGRIGRVNGTREAVVPHTPFILVYEVSAKAVQILGIWHGARLWPDSL